MKCNGFQLPAVTQSRSNTAIAPRDIFQTERFEDLVCDINEVDNALNDLRGCFGAPTGEATDPGPEKEQPSFHSFNWRIVSSSREGLHTASWPQLYSNLREHILWILHASKIFRVLENVPLKRISRVYLFPRFRNAKSCADSENKCNMASFGFSFRCTRILVRCWSIVSCRWQVIISPLLVPH